MENKNISNISLPDEAKAVVWRIFGAGTSHLNKLSTVALIEPVIKKKKYVPPLSRNDVSSKSVIGSNLMGINNGSGLI